MAGARLVFMDLETGGLEPGRHPVIQVAAVAVTAANLAELGTYEAKLEFDLSACTDKALELNSYDPEVWAKEARPPAQVCEELGGFLRQHATIQRTSKAGKAYRVARLAGHNLPAFDLPFLRELFKAHEVFLPAAFGGLDTMQLAGWVTRRRTTDGWGLQALAQELKLEAPAEDAHDALADVRLTVQVARQLMGVADA